MKKFFNVLVIVLTATAASVGTVYYMNSKGGIKSITDTSEATAAAPATPASYNVVGTTTDFSYAAERSVEAVVHVKTTYQTRQQTMSDPFFEFFFGRPGQQQMMPEAQASGSGVIISDDGYIVTNNHVIDKARQIQVVLNDKREFAATLVGTDPNTDIALLKIDATGLNTIPFGNSDELKIGEWVLAVGNPFNLTSTVTAGIVSAKARNINILNAEMKIESFIQTDAAVNPGNSGGALVNTRGELVGINTAIASQTGSYSGYSFAVPTSIVQKVVSDLRQYGIVQRAVLGIQMQEITEELKREKGLTTLQGAYVARVVEESAAYKAGIREGDVITQIDNKVIKTGTDLQETIGRHRPGDSVTITYIRNGAMKTTTANLTNRQGGTGLIEKTDNNTSLAADFEPLTEKEQRQLGINFGIKIKNLKNGKLKSAGLQNGYIILKANNRTIRSAEDLQEVTQNALNSNQRDKVLFLTACTPQGKVRYYAIDLSEE